MKLKVTFPEEHKGGPGSGHHGHAGRPGKRGGSVAGGAVGSGGSIPELSTSKRQAVAKKVLPPIYFDKYAKPGQWEREVSKFDSRLESVTSGKVTDSLSYANAAYNFSDNGFKAQLGSIKELDSTAGRYLMVSGNITNGGRVVGKFSSALGGAGKPSTTISFNNSFNGNSATQSFADSFAQHQSRFASIAGLSPVNAKLEFQSADYLSNKAPGP